jgi:hypothetical protein
MFRIGLILFFVAGIFCSGCRTYSPEAWAVWQKYRMVKPGMTCSQVYAIEPAPDGTFRTIDGKQMASWSFGTVVGAGDHAGMTVLFGKDGRVERVDRSIGHGRPPQVLTAWPTTNSTSTTP